jgi:hypothetical protein
MGAIPWPPLPGSEKEKADLVERTYRVGKPDIEDAINEMLGRDPECFAREVGLFPAQSDDDFCDIRGSPYVPNVTLTAPSASFYLARFYTITP